MGAIAEPINELDGIEIHGRAEGNRRLARIVAASETER
jgi:hypothetical protein